MCQGVDAHAALVNHPPGDPYNGAVLLNATHDHGSSADSGIGAHLNGSQHLGASSHHHVVGEGWVTFAAVFARTAKGDALIEQAAITNFAGFTNHHPHAVIDEHASADGGAGVDLDPGDSSPQLAEQASRQFQG